jgi:phospholipid/cholesterol/gamma-HCH transport system ATP-binding protein
LTAIVEIERVSFGYEASRPVLHDINVRMEQGQVIGVMGQSGCGKTTLLRIIGGALRPTAGSARVLGEEIGSLGTRELYALRRRMGMLFQFGALFTDLSVFDNVAFPLREHTQLPEVMIRDLVLLKLEAVGLRGAAGLRPSELSGGMARRVALARAIALDPKLIMYDEPFTALDPISLGAVARLIRTLNDSLGATSIVVTHDVAETLPFVDYVFFMAEGRVVAEGPPEAVARAKVPFVEQFVNGRTDGAVPFHFPAPGYASDLGIGAAA